MLVGLGPMKISRSMTIAGSEEQECKVGLAEIMIKDVSDSKQQFTRLNGLNCVPKCGMSMSKPELVSFRESPIAISTFTFPVLPQAVKYADSNRDHAEHEGANVDAVAQYIVRSGAKSV